MAKRKIKVKTLRKKPVRSGGGPCQRGSWTKKQVKEGNVGTDLGENEIRRRTRLLRRTKGSAYAKYGATAEGGL